MQKGTRDTVLGTVFFGGLGLLLWATSTLNDFSLGTRQMLTVEFDNARGLRIGEAVFLLGIQLGKVKNVSVQSKRDDTNELVFVTRAVLELDSEVELKSDTDIKVVDASMLGGKRVEIIPGLKGVPVKIGEHVFPGKAPVGPLEALGELVGGEKNRVNLEAVLENLKQFMSDLNNGKGTIAKLIKDDTLIRDAEALVASLRKSAESLEKSESLLGKVINDAEMGRKADEIVSDVERLTKRLNSTEGVLGKIINDTQLTAKFDKIVDKVDAVTANLAGSESALGRVINDSDMGKRFDNILANLEKTTFNLNDKNAGLIGALLTDEALLAEARKIVKDLAEVSDKVNTGKGALARLINDEDMGRRLDSMVNQITRAIEDAREAAPVGTFFQVFSGAF